MNAIIETCGKQYSVEKGTQLKLSRLEGQPGDEVKFDRVLMLQDGSISIGTPLIAGAEVKGKILAQGKAKKIVVYKYKRRKGYHKTKGHRQDQTLVEITDIRA